ncbi:hypothetical protein [Sediminibacillus halophilus]|uniref:Uncharacterized protein n=1 Tax=Sediminibacillus halophilus TaxID=482461 RepID=A0A1G9PQM0_9BACI|nr:hypothetical protein [Sediminibacillus halophilus]SDM01106.1 hypothetical protein SAMN05216244_1529 [Sediminibacillus halophilus]
MNKNGQSFFKDKKTYELDVDRMINEGLAGGTVRANKERSQIEESRDLPRQEQPFSDPE